MLIDLVRNFDDLKTGTACAVLLLKILNPEKYTHAEIAKILGRTEKQICRIEIKCRPQFQVMEWRERLEAMIQSDNDLLH